jgi:hypothetical protein
MRTGGRAYVETVLATPAISTKVAQRGRSGLTLAGYFRAQILRDAMGALTNLMRNGK